MDKERIKGHLFTDDYFERQLQYIRESVCLNGECKLQIFMPLPLITIKTQKQPTF